MKKDKGGRKEVNDSKEKERVDEMKMNKQGMLDCMYNAQYYSLLLLMRFTIHH